MAIQSEALRRLQEVREKHSQIEDADLAKKRQQLNQSLHVKKRFIPEKLERRHYIIAGCGVLGLLLLYIGITTPYRLIAPRFMLQRYEAALENQEYSTALNEISDYLELRPDEIEKQLAYSELLLITGQNVESAVVLSKVISDSPLAGDAEVLFLSAVAALPNIAEAEKRNNLTLASLNTYLPALVFRSLLSSRNNPELSLQDIGEAERQLVALSNAQQKYMRYNELLNLTLITLCRSAPAHFDHLLQPLPEAVPANLTQHQQLIAGIDSDLQANFCDFIPIAIDEYSSFAPKLESVVYLASAYSAVMRNDLLSARVAIGQGYQVENLLPNIFLDGVLLAQSGDYKKAINIWLRAGRISSVTYRHNLSIAGILNGPDSWEVAKENLDIAIRQDPMAFRSLNNRAVLSIIDDRISQANTDLQQALEAVPNYLFAVYNLGIIHLLNGEYEMAITNFNSVIEANEALPGLHYYLARAYDAVGIFERALSAYRLALQSPRFASLSNLAIGDYFSRDQISYEVAFDHYQTAYQLDESNYEAALKQAGMLAKLDNVAEALELADDSQQQFASLASDEQNYFQGLYALTKGQILFDNKRQGSAELLKDAFDNSTDEELRKQLAVLYTDVLLEGGFVREALDITRTILPSDPNNVDLLVARANALTAIQDIDQAMNIILTAEQASPENYKVMLAKASILTLDQRWQQAIDLYKESFFLNPANTEPLDQAIALLESISIDDKENQLAEFTNLRELVPKNYDELVERAEADTSTQLVQLKLATTDEDIAQMQEQITKLTELLETEQAEPYGALINRGIFHSRLGDYDSAIADMLTATTVADRPEQDYEAWVNLSQMYIATFRFPEANDAITKALERTPPNPTQLLFARAAVREKYDPAKAITDYDTLIEELPSSHDAYLRRGLSKVSIGNSQSAINDFTQAIRINPQLVEPYQARMSAYIVLGDRQAAAKDAETIGVLSRR